jgi:hypothetical protein
MADYLAVNTVMLLPLETATSAGARMLFLGMPFIFIDLLRMLRKSDRTSRRFLRGEELEQQSVQIHGIRTKDCVVRLRSCH